MSYTELSGWTVGVLKLYDISLVIVPVLYVFSGFECRANALEFVSLWIREPGKRVRCDYLIQYYANPSYDSGPSFLFCPFYNAFRSYYHDYRVVENKNVPLKYMSMFLLYSGFDLQLLTIRKSALKFIMNIE